MIDIKRNTRKITALIAAVIMYYIIHEGAHFIYAIATSCFERINFMFPGMQVQIAAEELTDFQLGIFCILGALATLTVGYALCLAGKRIGTIKSNLIRAIFYYVTLLFLLCDPVYLSLLCGFFGGGDMNGIALLIPKIWARVIMGLIGMINLIIIFKFVIPNYKNAFNTHNISLQGTP